MAANCALECLRLDNVGLSMTRGTHAWGPGSRSMLFHHGYSPFSLASSLAGRRRC